MANNAFSKILTLDFCSHFFACNKCLIHIIQFLILGQPFCFQFPFRKTNKQTKLSLCEGVTRLGLPGISFFCFFVFSQSTLKRNSSSIYYFFLSNYFSKYSLRRGGFCQHLYYIRPKFV